MKQSKLMGVLAAATLASALFAVDASALASRTFVASTGLDANTVTSCGRGAPCRNFQAAFGQTTPGGEIVALDSAGFGTLLITGPVTVTTLPGETAFVNVGGGSTGITVSAASGDNVILKNISFNGAGAASTTGVLVNSGKVVVRNCTFTQLTTGFFGTGFHNIIDSDFIANGTAITANGEGADTQVNTNGTTTGVKISGGNVVGNNTAFFMSSPGLRTCLNCTGNKINLYIRLLGNSTADFSTNVAGNTVFAGGSGTGCLQAFDCVNPGNYGGTTNPK
jgi:hypothetical protein